jgi:hypothetical protein
MREIATFGALERGLAVTPAEGAMVDIGFRVAAVSAAALMGMGKGGVPEKLVFRLVTRALLLISLKLIWDGATGLI